MNTTDEEHALSQNKVTSLPNTPSYIKAKNIIHIIISSKSYEPEHYDSSL